MNPLLPPLLVRFATAVLPELDALPAAERDDALRRAFAEPLDVAELLVGAFALVAVAWMARHGTLVGGAAALFVFSLAAAATTLRRLRRGLHDDAAGARRGRA